MGIPSNPAILFIHGYPTCSFDFKEMMYNLSNDFYVVALDTPGYGISSKPKGDYRYSIEDDAKLVEYYVTEILGLKNFSMFTHDKGSSVGFAFLGQYQNKSIPEFNINHHFITNGNVWLPLAQLSLMQYLLLGSSGEFFEKFLAGSIFSSLLQTSTHSKRESYEVVQAMASMFDYEDGCNVQHETIQYLAQRAVNEGRWLSYLNASDVPTTIIWGEKDNIAPVAVANFIWDNALKHKSNTKRYFLENANHYLQNDDPDGLCVIIRNSISSN